MASERLFRLPVGVHCPGCPVRAECHPEECEQVCSEHWDEPGHGGEEVLHPVRTDIQDFIGPLHGLQLSNIVALPVAIPKLKDYVPQIPFRPGALSGHLDACAYALRPEAIARSRIKSAEELRKAFQLRPDQKLIALLFDADERLEQFYRPEVLRQLAAADYDLIAAPSFSIWSPRPRLHQLYNLTRSLAVCVALQSLGAPAIPRVDWAESPDVDRCATWLNDNACVELVAIDSMTSKSQGWEQALAGLVRLDHLTEGRLRYLINGPSVPARWENIYAAVPAGRITLTDARLWPALPSTDEQLRFRTRTDGRIDRGLMYRNRVSERTRAIEIAKAA